MPRTALAYASLVLALATVLHAQSPAPPTPARARAPEPWRFIGDRPCTLPDGGFRGQTSQVHHGPLEFVGKECGTDVHVGGRIRQPLLDLVVDPGIGHPHAHGHHTGRQRQEQTQEWARQGAAGGLIGQRRARGRPHRSGTSEVP